MSLEHSVGKTKQPYHMVTKPRNSGDNQLSFKQRKEELLQSIKLLNQSPGKILQSTKIEDQSPIFKRRGHLPKAYELTSESVIDPFLGMERKTDIQLSQNLSIAFESPQDSSIKACLKDDAIHFSLFCEAAPTLSTSLTQEGLSSRHLQKPESNSLFTPVNLLQQDNFLSSSSSTKKTKKNEASLLLSAQRNAESDFIYEAATSNYLLDNSLINDKKKGGHVGKESKKVQDHSESNDTQSSTPYEINNFIEGTGPKKKKQRLSQLSKLATTSLFPDEFTEHHSEIADKEKAYVAHTSPNPNNQYNMDEQSATAISRPLDSFEFCRRSKEKEKDNIFLNPHKKIVSDEESYQCSPSRKITTSSISNLSKIVERKQVESCIIYAKNECQPSTHVSKKISYPTSPLLKNVPFIKTSIIEKTFQLNKSAINTANDQRATTPLYQLNHDCLNVAPKKLGRNQLLSVECATCRSFYSALSSWDEGNLQVFRPDCTHMLKDIANTNVMKASEIYMTNTQLEGAENALRDKSISKLDAQHPTSNIQQSFSRHRIRDRSPETPKGFWDVDFND